MHLQRKLLGILHQLAGGKGQSNMNYIFAKVTWLEFGYACVRECVKNKRINKRVLLFK